MPESSEAVSQVVWGVALEWGSLCARGKRGLGATTGESVLGRWVCGGTSVLIRRKGSGEEEGVV